MSLGDWVTRAACGDVDPDLFFSGGKPTAETRAICESCPVRDECAVQALTSGEEDGIWASLMPWERRVYRKQLLKKHGGRIAAREASA